MSTEKRTKHEGEEVSEAVIRRLPRYYRYLGDLCAKGVLRVSSAELSKMIHVTSSQIRQDFNCFGGFGQQGYGYNVRFLYSKIAGLLGVNSCLTCIVVGAGNLGKALLSSPMFQKRGVTVVGVFDNDSAVIGTEVAGHTVMDIREMEKFLSSVHVDIGVLTVPRGCAEELAGRMAENHIAGIWNFSNAYIDGESLGVAVETVHLGDSLMKLMYQLNEKYSREV